MSREFGENGGWFFHDKINNAAKDCEEGGDDLTKLWGKFLEQFHEIAYAISTSEASDSGPDYPILETIKNLGALKEKLAEIERYVDQFQGMDRREILDTIKAKTIPIPGDVKIP